MGIKAKSSAHTKWLCKYHIVFSPKFRRKVIFNNIHPSVGKIFRDLCKYKGVEIIRRLSDARPCSYASQYSPKAMYFKLYGDLKGKSSLMIFDRHTNLKYKFGNRTFWLEG
ncbi:TPA: IS200/IS605 family transposase [Providencia alcalifaciens]